MKIVLGIGAHPDDLEIFCGGTLARFRRQGWEVVMASVCSGDKGGESSVKDSMAATRKREAGASAAVIEAESVILGFPDSGIVTGDGLRRVVADLIRRVRPAVVITHSPEDYHADHKAVAEETVNSAYIASSKGFKTRHKPVESIPLVYYMETFAGIGFVPTEYVDITGTVDVKIEMLGKHVSQFQNLKARGGVDIIELVKDTAKFRGWQSGVKYAEGFCPASCWPNFRTGRILP